MAGKNRVSEVFGVPVFTAVASAPRTSAKTGEKFRKLADVVIPIKGVDSKIIAGIRGEISARQPKTAAKAHAEFKVMSSFYRECLDVPVGAAAEWEAFKGEVMDRYLAWTKETGNSPQNVNVGGVELDMSL